MNGLLITGGEKPDSSMIKKLIMNNWVIAAADSGLDWAGQEGIEVQYCVGDMDSLEDKSLLNNLSNESVFRYSSDKDDTDTEIGIELLRNKGCTRIIICGAGGGRSDHFLAVYSLFDRNDPPDEWYTANEHFVLIKDRLEIKKPAGTMISFFPVGKEVCSMKTSGLKWPLDKLRWEKGDFGISNLSTNGEIKVIMKSGRLLMIYNICKGENE